MNNTESTEHLCEKSYMQGIEDMKEIILTIEQMYDNSNDDNDNDLLTELFGCSHDNYRMIFDNDSKGKVYRPMQLFNFCKTGKHIDIGNILKELENL